MLDKEKILNTIQSATNPLPLIEALVRVAGAAEDLEHAWCGQEVRDLGPARRKLFAQLAELERLVEGEK